MLKAIAASAASLGLLKSAVTPPTITTIPSALTIAHVLSGVERSSAAGRTAATADARKNQTALMNTNAGSRTSSPRVSSSNSRVVSASVNQNGPLIATPHELEAGSPSAQIIPAIARVIGKK